MVTIYGNSISGGFTSGTPLVAIYTYGCQVWPVEESWTGPWPGPEVHPGDFYVRWTPSTAQGYFFGGNLEDYGGYYELSRSIIPNVGFDNCTEMVTVETTALSIGIQAFTGCTSITSVNLPHCTSVGRSAFSGCLNIQSVSMPECTWISPWAFTYNTQLSAVVLPNVEYVDQYAFASCYSLGYIMLGRNCGMVGSHAFDRAGMSTGNNMVYSMKLSYAGSGICVFGTQTSFVVQNLYVPWWKTDQYSNWAYLSNTGNIYGYYYVSYPGYYSEESYGTLSSSGIFGSGGVPSYFETDAGVVARGMNDTPSPFENNSTLVSASMSQLITVSARGFYSCTNLRELYAPKLQEISGHAFTGCTSLEYMDIPNCSVIGNSAFFGCTSLSYIMLGLSSCELGSYAFYGCSNLQSILVPSSYVEDYRSAVNWSDYASLIVGYGSEPGPEPQTETIDFSTFGLVDREVVDYDQSGKTFAGDSCEVKFTISGSGTKATYYIAQSAVRIYNNCSVVIESDRVISSVKFTWSSSYKPTTDDANPQGYDPNTETWTGSSNSVTLTKTTTSNWRLISVTVTYE